MADLEANKAIYRKFVDTLNRQDLDSLPEVLDTATYREICVGAMPDFVNYDAAIASVKMVFTGTPDIAIHVEDIVAEGDKVFARAKVSGTNSGPMMGMPPSGRTFTADMFDYVKVQDGKIVERIQMPDNMGIMQQLTGGAPGMPGGG
jgi:predicted ester cyclase